MLAAFTVLDLFLSSFYTQKDDDALFMLLELMLLPPVEEALLELLLPPDTTALLELFILFSEAPLLSC